MKDRQGRFWGGVDKTGECWLWLRSCNAKGYGVAFKRLAHRVAWEFEHGPVPEGMFVCHRCDNPPCVRPDHLFLGTAFDNMRDMVNKGRHVTNRGAACNRAKFSDLEIIDIRRAWKNGISQAELARAYKVRPYTIWLIIHRRTWKHLPESLALEVVA